MKPIIIAGLGRCGTTLVRDTFEKSGYIKARRFLKVIKPNSYEEGIIYKTHAYPPDALQSDVKLIFLYDDPYDIIYSTYKQMNRWGKNHHIHFESSEYVENKSVLRKDTLNLEKMFRAWMSKKPFKFLSVPYKSLSNIENQQKIASFTNHEFKIEDFKKRTPVSHQSREFKIMKDVYLKSYQLYNQYPVLKEWK